MPNEFIIKNGFRSQGNSQISGSITMDGAGNILVSQAAYNAGARIGTIGGYDFYYGAFNGLFVGYQPNFGRWGVSTASSRNLEIYQGSAYPITFWTSGTERLRILSDGNVGIGTSTSTSKLTILGSGTTSATTAFTVQNANATNMLSLTDNGALTVNTFQTSSTALTINRTNSTMGGNFNLATMGTLINIQDTVGNSNSSKTTIYIASTGASTNNAAEIYGGVGIGYAPYGNNFYVGYNTVIYNTARVLASSTFGLSSRSSISTYDAGNGGGISFWGDDRAQGLASAAFGGIRGIKENSTYVNSLGNLAFYVQSNSGGGQTESTFLEAARFNSSGNFGLGTSTPSAKIHISGSSGSALLEIDSPAVNNILYVSGSGNVGIGTGTPSKTLEVYKGGLVDGNVEGIRITGQHASATAQVALEFYHTYGLISRISTDIGNGGLFPSMYFIHNGITAMKIANTGNVQIGTTTDSGYKLDVNGSFRTSNQVLFRSTAGYQGFRSDGLYSAFGYNTNEENNVVLKVGFAVGTSVNTLLKVDNTANSTASGPTTVLLDLLANSSQTANLLQWRNSSGTILGVINNIGNVGIGTSTPTSRLSVSGSAGTGSAIYAYKSGSTVLDIQGSQGQLFSVVDALSGSLMSVNDVSGLPILEVFSDDRVVMGTYGAPALIITGSNTVISGSLRGRVVTLSTASATASMDCSLSNFFDLTLSGSMYLNVSNIQPGETINLRITQPATSGSLNYTSSIKFPNGLPYSASATSSVVDLISFISFDSSTLYATSLKNLV